MDITLKHLCRIESLQTSSQRQEPDMNAPSQRTPLTDEVCVAPDSVPPDAPHCGGIRQWLYRHAVPLAFGLIFCTMLAPLLRDGIWKGHDRSAHELRILNTLSALEDGQYPPVINSAHENALGYSWNLFYPPLSAYVATGLTLALKAVGVPSPFAALKLTWFLIILASAASMYWFLRHVFRSTFASCIGTCLYVTAPYFVSCVFVRFALGEIMIFVFLPILALGLYSVFYEEGEKNWLMTIGVAGIVLSNTPASILALLCLTVFSLLHIHFLQDGRVIRMVAVNAVLTFGITAFYIIPFFELWKSGTVHAFVNMEGTSWESFTHQSVKLWWLLIPRKINRIFLYFGFPTLFCAGWLFFKVPQTKGTKILAVAALLLILAMSEWMPWKYLGGGPLEIVKYLQFPWRMLSVTIFLLCILSAHNARLYFTDKAKPCALLAISAVCVLAMFVIFPSTRIQPIATKETGSDDYLPEKSIPFRRELATMKAVPTLLSGNATIENIDKNRTKLSFTIVNAEGHAVIELPYFAYLGYTATLRKNDSTTADLELYESPRGLWSVTVPEHTTGKVSLAYTGTKATKLGSTISLAACALLPLYILAGVFLSHRRKPPPLSPPKTAE